MGQPVFLVEFEARVWPRYFASGTPHALGSQHRSTARVPIVGGITYKVTAQVRRDASANGTFSLFVNFYDAAGAAAGGLSLVSGVTPGTGWATYSATFGATGGAIPVGAVSMVPAFALNFAGTAGKHHIKAYAIENNAVPGVALSADAATRNLALWSFGTGSAATMLTEVDGTLQTLALRYATSAYVSQAADTPPNTPYEARVINPGLVRSELPRDWRGAINGSFGEIVFANVDGVLSDWMHHGVNGQKVRVFYGQSDGARSTFTCLITAMIQQAVIGRKSVQLRLQGNEVRLAAPLLTTEHPSQTFERGLRYLGTNALPSGIEGTASDLIGLPRPRLYGKVVNLVPPCINTSRQIYEVHNAATTGLYAAESISLQGVRVRGAAVTAGANYTNLADLEANAPGAGTYRVWPQGGLFRLGSAPDGLVTCDASMWPAPGGRTGWQDLASLITWEADFVDLRVGSDNAMYPAPANWTGAGVSAGNRGADVGVWVNDERSAADVLTAICASAGAWFGYVEWSNIFMGDTPKLGYEVFPPALDTYSPNGSPTPDLALVPSFDEANLLAVTALPDPGSGRGTPVWNVTVGYAVNATPITVDIASGVSQADRAALAAAIFRVSVADANVSLQHPNARSVVRDTALVSRAAAEDEAYRLLHLMKTPRVWMEATAPIAAVLGMAVKPRLGGYVKLIMPNFTVLHADGTMQGQAYYTVQALEIDLQQQAVRMTLRQATEQTRV